MGEISVNGSSLGNALSELLTGADIIPGDQPSYELCKTLWLYHPLGKKMVEAPIEMAQSQEREITVPGPAQDRVSQKFLDQWNDDRADDIILNAVATSRAYGVSSLALMIEGLKPADPVPWKKLADAHVSWSIFDPLNTAGSIVLNQDPLAIDFQKVTNIAVSGERFHRSRTVTIMHERPVYIAYTGSAFGFVGRSVFQRALFPLKSFIQSMVTDDLVTLKAGVFIAKLKTAGVIIDKIMQSSATMKRLFLKVATVMNANVLSIGTDEDIETLNMQNLDGAYKLALDNIKANIAVAADMPAIVLKDETYTEGFGEGQEDAKHVARWVARTRKQMDPVYRFMDNIIMRRAWNEEFFETLQDVPEYKAMSYEQAFAQWQTKFSALWPNLLTEPDSEKVKTDETKLKGIVEVLEVLGQWMDPENKATLVGWAQDNLNENKLMFQTPLLLNLDDLANYVPPMPTAGAGGAEEDPAAKPPKMPRPDSASMGSASTRRKLRKMSDSELGDLIDLMQRAEPGEIERMRSGLEKMAA